MGQKPILNTFWQLRISKTPTIFLERYKIFITPNAEQVQKCKSFLIDLLKQNLHDNVDQKTLVLLCSLSTEEAGLLLSNTVFPLGQSEFAAVPPVNRGK